MTDETHDGMRLMLSCPRPELIGSGERFQPVSPLLSYVRLHVD